jgi:dTDP-4-amino-4,6-dideoxygalactose transaminase
MMLQCNIPLIKEIDILKVEQQLRSGNLAQGDKVFELESRMSRLTNREHSAAYSSATSIFEAIFAYIGIEEGDEVILSPLTFKSVPYAVIRAGATPIFIDTNEFYLADWNKVDSLLNKNTKAIISTSLYGMPDPNFDRLLRSLEYYPDVWMIEDNAQSIGAKYNKTDHVGSWESRSDFSIFSFYATKNITGGEGGIVVFNEDTDFFHSYRNNGICKNFFNKNCVGTNMRMTDIEASLVLSQMNRVEQVTKIRNDQSNIYHNLLSIENLQFKNLHKNATHAYHHYTLTLPKKMDRSYVLSRLESHGIHAGVYYEYLVNYDKNFTSPVRVSNTPNALLQSKQAICLPLGETLNHSDINYIAQKFEEIVNSESAA